jgi:hypothetical protein
MTEPTKAARIKLHSTYIAVGTDGESHQTRCRDCSYEGPEHDHRRYLAEFDAEEHQRAMAGWPL